MLKTINFRRRAQLKTVLEHNKNNLPGCFYPESYNCNLAGLLACSLFRRLPIPSRKKIGSMTVA